MSATPFQLHYRKHKYTPEKIDSALLFDIQNYIPIYSRFFDINETNYNGIQLNQRYYLQNIIEHPTRIIDHCGDRDRDRDRDRGAATTDADADAREHHSLNHLETVIGDDNGSTNNVPMFVKYSPLLDPIRYLSGKYQVHQEKTRSLPKFNSTPETCEDKMLDVNNSSYVDGFFSYLTSKTLHTHGIVHGLDYYGSYLCKQREFSTNVFDDIEYLVDCSFFNEYENELFTIDYSQFGEDDNESSDINTTKMMKLRNKMKSMFPSEDKTNRLHILEPSTVTSIDVGSEIIEGGGYVSGSGSGCVADNTCIDIDTSQSPATEVVELNVADLLQPVEVDVNVEPMLECDVTDVRIHAGISKNSRTKEMDGYSSSDDSSQSNSSYTTIEGDDDADGNDDGNDDADADADADAEHGNREIDDSSFSTGSNANTDTDTETDTDADTDTDDDGSYDSDDEQIIVKIKDYPIQAILLERCVSTLDHIMMMDELTKEEWTSILFQVVMTLLIYQKMFAFTHNDLHTNNVMFIETTEEFIYYLYEGQYYKVPTYGRIFKIIDFGRAIYKFRGQLICSDSFHPKGDAATQYNFPPYYNPDKPTVEPNFSFDLCRFACALFDYFIYDLRKVEKLCKSDPIIKLIVKWTMDDKGRNVLYKTSGEERYPDFKLYKMISRSVHNHVPSSEIHNPLFDEYKITYKKYKKHASLAAKFLKNGKNTHILMNVDTLPVYVD